jgi:hypothetical protein
VFGSQGFARIEEKSVEYGDNDPGDEAAFHARTYALGKLNPGSRYVFHKKGPLLYGGVHANKAMGPS